jgi:hypothetical protein
MIRIEVQSKLENLLERNLWNSGSVRLFLSCVPLAFAFFLLQNAAEVILDWLATGIGLPGRLDGIKQVQARMSWLSPLLLAPVLESLLCLLWIRLLSPRWGTSWWLVPLIVALVAGAFHVLAYMEVRYASITVNFFAICCLIQNVRNRVAGFWASVFIHALMNAMVMAQLRLSMPASG